MYTTGTDLLFWSPALANYQIKCCQNVETVFIVVEQCSEQ
jgi:hypothetical protein